MRKHLSQEARTDQVKRDVLIHVAVVLALIIVLPMAAKASPFDSGVSQLQTLFTGTIAKATSLIAIVLGGFGFAFGDPGAKKNLAGVAMGTGVAVLATNVLSWLWGA